MNVISVTDVLHIPVKNEGFRIGQVLDGVVIDVDREGIALVNLGGKTITVASGSEMLQIGETVRLKIIESGSEGVFADRVDSKETAVLNKLGISVSTENLGYISELMKSHQPIDKVLLSRLQKNAQEVKLFTELLSSVSEAVDMDAPIRKLVIAMLQKQSAPSDQGVNASQNTGDALPKNSPQAEMQYKPNLTVNDTQAMEENGHLHYRSEQGQGNKTGNLLSQNHFLPQDIPSQGKIDIQKQESMYSFQTNETAENHLEEIHIELSRSSSAVPEEGGSGNEELRQNLEKTDSSPVDFPAKMTMGNLKKEAALKILFSSPDSSNREELIDAVKYLSANFEAKDNIALALQNKALSLRNMAQSQLDVSDITEQFLQISGELQDGKDFSVLLKDLENGYELEQAIAQRYPKWKMISDAVKEQIYQKNPGIYYISLPVRIMGEERRTDIYLKRSSKKSNELSILVALNTKNLGEVRCMVYKIDQDYTLGFALENERIATLVRERLADFKSGVKNLQIVIRSREEVEDAFFEKKDMVSNCDLRV